MSMEFEDILSIVGGYGKFQKTLTLTFIIPLFIVLPMVPMNLFFMVNVPEHSCYVPELASSKLSVSEQRTLTRPTDDPSCSMYDINYTRFVDDEDFGMFNKSKETISCTNGWTYDKKDFDVTVATKWDLVCGYNQYPSLVLMFYRIGNVCFTPLIGLFSDKFGRKTGILLATTIAFSTEIASLFVNDFILFAILRTLNGAAMPQLFLLSFILISELVAPEMRGHMNGIINVAWTVGMCIVPLVAYLSSSWIYLGLATAAAEICILFYWNYIPESPCWLISHGKYEEATAILMKIGHQNGKSLNRSAILLKLQTLGADIKKKKEVDVMDTKSRFLRYPRLRRNVLILSICWTAFNMGYLGLTYNIVNLNGNEYLNFFLLGIVELPGDVLAWVLMDRCGRRWTTSIGFIITGITSLLPLIGFRYSEIISSIIAKLLISAVIMVTEVQASELFPTVYRSFGMGTGKTIAAFATLVVPYIAYLSQYGKSIPFVIISLMCFISGGLSSLLPETLNKNLPQTIVDAEEFGKEQTYFSWIRPKKPSKTADVSFIQPS